MKIEFAAFVETLSSYDIVVFRRMQILLKEISIKRAIPYSGHYFTAWDCRMEDEDDRCMICNGNINAEATNE